MIDKIFPADPMRNDYTQGITCGAALATEYIKQLPSADVVEVVRCGECVYYNGETHGCVRNPSLAPWEESDYCKYGEHDVR